jgi:hypothetical protein
MKNIKFILIIAALMLLMSMGALSSQADAEPVDAPYLDEQPHTLAAQTDTWYRFEFIVYHPGFICKFVFCPDRAVYHGDIIIRMVGAEKSGLQIEVYAPQQITRWRDEDPVGRGNPENDDLVWTGGANDNGTWYVRVVNETNRALAYRFAVQGERVLLSRETPAPATPTPSFWERYQASRQPTPTPTPITITPTDPSKAAEVDGKDHTFAAHSEWWYIVTFPLGRDKITVKLLDGASNGLQFDVYTPERVNQWWKEDPVGRGDAEGNDLVWTGDRDDSAKRYIRIVNPTGRAVNIFLAVDTYAPKPAPKPFEGR